MNTASSLLQVYELGSRLFANSRGGYVTECMGPIQEQDGGEQVLPVLAPSSITVGFLYKEFKEQVKNNYRTTEPNNLNSPHEASGLA
jgi:hypothetical protein